MLRLIWNSWKRQKERFILLIIGALLMSSGLSYLLGLTETNRGTVVENLQKKWKSSYDIVVRPQGTKNESNHLLEPNYLNGIAGGIKQEQYEKIKRIEEVETAAPIAVMGYIGMGAGWKNPLKVSEPGIYRMHTKITENNGLQESVITNNVGYCINGLSNEDMKFIGKCESVGWLFTQEALIVGVDPEQEARLVGLEKAMENFPGSRYFTNNDKPVKASEHSSTIPIIVNSKAFISSIMSASMEKLSVPLETKKEQDEVRKRIKKEESAYLDSLSKEKIIGPIQITNKEVEKEYYGFWGGIDPNTGQRIEHREENVLKGAQIRFKPTPLTYKSSISPYKERWQTALQIESKKLHIQDELKDYASINRGFRDLQFTEQQQRPLEEGESDAFPSMYYDVIGFYNPNKLPVSKDPLNELPLETYRPAKASIVLDEKNEPMNPTREVTGSGHPTGLLTNPPNVLTTIEAAKAVLGDGVISAIRIKVKGAGKLGEDSQKKLESIAAQIERETGLVADITRGSSPQPVLMKVVNEGKVLGWIEQPWINLGAAMTIFRETTMGYSGVMMTLLGVAVLYVLATNIVSLLARRREFAVLLALGWKTNHLVRMVFLESCILCGTVITVSFGIEGIMYVQTGQFLWGKMIIIIVCSVLIYLLGTAIPAYLIARITPYDAMKEGEVSIKGKRWMRTSNLVMMVWNQIVAKWQRNLLSILSIAIPTMLLSLYLFVTFRLKGVLYTSWVGQYVAMKVDATHYITLGIALAVAIVTTAEMMWQNIAERKPEISVLKSIGWTDGAVRFTVLLEGGFLGCIAGVLGVILSLIVIGSLYNIFPWDSIFILLLTILIPIIVGIIGALLPGEVAVRQKPFQAMKRI